MNCRMLWLVEIITRLVWKSKTDRLPEKSIVTNTRDNMRRKMTKQDGVILSLGNMTLSSGGGQLPTPRGNSSRHILLWEITRYFTLIAMAVNVVLIRITVPTN